MRVYLAALGCRLNYAEMTALGRQLEIAGHELAASTNEADICVFNSCAVTGEAARKSRQLARQMARTNPLARLVVTGCYATLEGEAVAGLPNVSLVVDNTRKDDLLALIQEFDRRPPTAEGQAAVNDVSYGLSSNRHSQIQDPKSPNPIPSSGRGDVGNRTRAFVKVQDGCRNRCTFCIVAVARGNEHSRPTAEVVDEVNALHREGYQEAVLTGVHLGAYGRDRDTDLRSLIAALLSDTCVPRLRLSSLEPFDLTPEFFDLWATSDGRLMPHLHLPAQSGSDAVLRRMARRNHAADFEALVATARTRIPGLTITTDLIAGFPGESEVDFEETVAFARRVGFAHMHVFPYSPRAGTMAARFNGQLPEAERRYRSRLLSELDIELGRALRASFLGQTRPVLWENPVQPAGELGTRNPVIWSGFTDNYLRVRSPAVTGLELHNRITWTRLTQLGNGELWGEIVTR